MSKHFVIPLNPDSKSNWNEALKGINHSFSHTWDNCYAMQLTTNYDTFLFCYENEDVKIVCPYAERKFGEFTDIVTPYGFSGFCGNGDHREFRNYWNDYVKSKNYVCGYISLNPAFQNDSYFNSDDVSISTNLYFINLNQSLTDIFENLDSNRKKQIKDFRKVESSFIYDKKILTEFFIDNYYDFLKRVNASRANYFKKETLEYICSLENIFIAGAGKDNKVEAVYIFGFTEYVGDCMFNVAVPEGRKYASFLLWRGLKYFRSRKIPLMNLGGGMSKDDSVALSKERFGAYKLPFASLKQIYNSAVYDKLCNENKSDPHDLRGYFPAYRKVH